MSEWISVEDKKPCGDLDQSGTVDFLVMLESREMVVANYFPKMGIWNMPISYHEDVVTHWMPLPEPPK